MRGFKEDFDAWKSALTPEEQKQVQAQAEGEFNKNFRKSDEFKKDLPEEKVKSFAKILSKFFDNESADYKKELEAKVPNYNMLLEKAGDKVMDFSLKNKIIEVDRDAERRYRFATMKNFKAQEAGELYPQSSPLKEIWAIRNNDTESHELAEQHFELLKKAAASSKCPPAEKAAIESLVKKGVPPIGENIEIRISQVLSNQYFMLCQLVKNGLEDMKQNKTEAEVQAFVDKDLPVVAAKVMKSLQDSYIAARDEVQNDVDTMKKIFRSQKERPGKTKADILKEIWAELPKVVDKPVPPLDEEMLAELAEEPAVIEQEFKHSWGIADKLYKSEAIDAFGMKYLLGVFETQKEAQKAFEDWNKEYEQARVEMKGEMQEWSKQENARLDKDPSGRERIKKVLEEARR